jgi:hypothetical protein
MSQAAIRREAMTYLPIVLAGLAIGVALPAGSAFAQADRLPPKVREMCESDYRKFCAATLPGGGRILACMRSNSARLADACRAALNEVKASIGQSGSTAA